MVRTHEDIPSMAEKSSRTFAEPAGFPCDFAFGALGFDHFFCWGAQSCRMLLAFVRMRMPYDACCPDFVCSRNANSQTCFHHFVLEFSPSSDCGLQSIAESKRDEYMVSLPRSFSQPGWAWLCLSDGGHKSLLMVLHLQNCKGKNL